MTFVLKPGWLERRQLSCRSPSLSLTSTQHSSFGHSVRPQAQYKPIQVKFQVVPPAKVSRTFGAIFLSERIFCFDFLGVCRKRWTHQRTSISRALRARSFPTALKAPVPKSPCSKPPVKHFSLSNLLFTVSHSTDRLSHQFSQQS